jgi:hypothetical protein
MATKSVHRASLTQRRKHVASIADRAFHNSFEEAFRYLAEVNSRGSTKHAIAMWLQAMRERLEQSEEAERERLVQGMRAWAARRASREAVAS